MSRPDRNPCDSCFEDTPLLYRYNHFYFCHTCRAKILVDEPEEEARKHIYLIKD